MSSRIWKLVGPSAFHGKEGRDEERNMGGEERNEEKGERERRCKG